MFAVNRDKFYPNHVDKKEETTEHLPPGIYRFDVEGGLFFSRPIFIKEAYRDGLIDLKGQPFDGVKKKLSGFFNEKTVEIYKDTQTRHFIGCMLYGPPGTGKTCFIDIVCNHFSKVRDAVTLRITDAENLENLNEIVKMLRNNTDRMVIILLEELDKIMESGWGRSKIEKWLIDFCDGQNTPSNVLMIASTNHIDKIPASLKERPSRFSIVNEVDTIPTEIALQLVKKLVPEKYRDKVNVQELAFKVTESAITIDQVKYVVLNMLCIGMTVDEAIETVTTKPGVKVHAEDEEEEEEEDS